MRIPHICLVFAFLWTVNACLALEVIVSGVVNTDPTGQSRVGTILTFTFSLNQDPDAGLEGALFNETMSAWYRGSTSGLSVYTALTSSGTNFTGALSLEDDPNEPIELIRARPGGEFDLQLRSDHATGTGLSYGIYPIIEIRADLKSDIPFVMPGETTALVPYLDQYKGTYTANENSFIAIQTSGGGTVTLDATSFSIQTPPEATFEHTVIDGEVTITKYNCDAVPGSEITIPSTIDNLPVTRIGYRAFFQCREAFSLIIPDSVTAIEAEAFGACGLTSVVIPDSVTELGDSIFNLSIGLTSVTLGTGVTTIPSGTFEACYSLTSVTINGQITSIGDSAFKSSALSSLTIPETVMTIGGAAFSSTKLTQITLPDAVTSFGGGAFLNCAVLETIVMGDGITAIPDLAFQFCTSLTDVTIGKNVDSIGAQAFSSCNTLTELVLPEKVTTLGDGAFFNSLSFNALYCLGVPPTAGQFLFLGASSSLKVYYIEGYPDWPAMYETAPTEAFDPDWLWGRYEYIDAGSSVYVDSGDWLGILYVTLSPWIWHPDTSSWLYINEPVAAANGGWIYIPDLVLDTPDLWILRGGESDFAYSHGLGRWLYMTESGWVYLL